MVQATSDAWSFCLAPPYSNRVSANFSLHFRESDVTKTYRDQNLAAIRSFSLRLHSIRNHIRDSVCRCELPLYFGGRVRRKLAGGLVHILGSDDSGRTFCRPIHSAADAFDDGKGGVGSRLWLAPTRRSRRWMNRDDGRNGEQGKRTRRSKALSPNLDAGRASLDPADNASMRMARRDDRAQNIPGAIVRAGDQ